MRLWRREGRKEMTCQLGLYQLGGRGAGLTKGREHNAGKGVAQKELQYAADDLQRSTEKVVHTTN